MASCRANEKPTPHNMQTQSASTIARNERQSSLTHTLVSALLFSCVLIICFVRMPDRLQDGYLWAEDGPIFIKQAIELGLPSVFTPYAGYLHFDARLIAYAAVNVVPLAQIPYAMPWVCAAVYGLLAIYTQRTCFRLLHGDFPEKLVVSACMALVPIIVPQTGEVYLSVTNLQWSLAPVLLLCLYEMTAAASALTAWQRAARGAFIITSTLTGPFGALFFPAVGLVAAHSFLKRREEAVWPALAGYVVAIAVQAYFVKTSPGADPGAGVNPLQFPWAEHFFRYFLGELFIQRAFLPSLGGSVFSALCLAWCVMTGSRRRVKVMLVLIAVGMWFVGVTRGGTLTIPVTWTGFGSRYLFIPHILILWALLANLTSDGFWRRALSASLIGAALGVSFAQFELNTWTGLPWSVEKISASEYLLKTAPAPWKAVIRMPAAH